MKGIKLWFAKYAVGFIVPIIARNKAAAAILATLASGGSWMELVKTIARLHPEVGAYTELIEKPAFPTIRHLVDRYDGEADFAVEILDVLVEPFKKE